MLQFLKEPTIPTDQVNCHFLLQKWRLIVLTSNAQDISWYPNRTLEVNLIKIKLVSGKSEGFKKKLFWLSKIHFLYDSEAVLQQREDF